MIVGNLEEKMTFRWAEWRKTIYAAASWKL